MPDPSAFDRDSRDKRLDKALTLLDNRAHWRRNGLLSLAALVAFAVSGTLLATILSGHEEPAPVRKAPLVKESVPEVSTAAETVPVKQAVLIATER